MDSEKRLRLTDTKRFKAAAKLISGMTVKQARFALLLVNQQLRGYLGMPERQVGFLDNLKRAIKARKGGVK